MQRNFKTIYIIRGRYYRKSLDAYDNTKPNLTKHAGSLPFQLSPPMERVHFQ